MAKLYFYYSAMNAGKTTTLLQSSHNYAERGMTTLLLKPLIDDREGLNVIRSRVGLEAEAKNFEKDDNLLQTIKAQHKTKSLNCVLLDEAQFLTRDQVIQLGDVVDRLEIPVLCYGLRTDFLGELFEGSRSLLAWADELREIKTVCHCGKKAIMTVRLNEEGKPLQAGEQIQIGGNESYVSMCRRHFKSSLGLSEI
ncbi:MAG: thymidine kinase [bacterium]